MTIITTSVLFYDETQKCLGDTTVSFPADELDLFWDQVEARGAKLGAASIEVETPTSWDPAPLRGIILH